MGNVQAFKVSGRKVRQIVDAQSRALESLPSVLRTLESRIAEATVANGELRVIVRAQALKLNVASEWRALSFWRRLKWLLRGISGEA